MASTRSRRSGGTAENTLNPATIQFLDAARLRKELEMRGLDTSGTKNTLADRLDEAVQLEKMGGLVVPLIPSPEKSPTKPKKSKVTARKSESTNDSDIESTTNTDATVAVESLIDEIPDQQQTSSNESLKRIKRKSAVLSPTKSKQRKSITIDESPPSPIIEDVVVEEKTVEKSNEVLRLKIKPPIREEKVSKRQQDASTMDRKKKSHHSDRKAATVASLITARYTDERESDGDNESVTTSSTSDDIGRLTAKRQRHSTDNTTRSSLSTTTDTTSGLFTTDDTITKSSSPSDKTTPSVIAKSDDSTGTKGVTSSIKPLQKRIPIRHQASIDVLDNIFDNQTKMLTGLNKSEKTRADERQKIELEKRRISNVSLTLGLGPLVDKTTVESPTTPGLRSHSELPPPPPPPGLPPATARKRSRGSTDSPIPLLSESINPEILAMLPPPPPPPRPIALITGSVPSSSINETIVSTTSPIGVAPRDKPLTENAQKVVDALVKFGKINPTVLARAVAASRNETETIIKKELIVAESDVNRNVSMNTEVQIVEDISITNVVINTPITIKEEEISDTFDSNDTASNTIVFIDPIDTNEETKEENTEQIKDRIIDIDQLSIIGELLVDMCNNVAEQELSSSNISTIDHNMDIEVMEMENASSSSVASADVCAELMSNPRALLDRASAALQQMQQQQSLIKSENNNEDNITQYEQVPPDPDCAIIEEDKPLPHFHGEPVPPDDEDEDATIDDDDDMEVMMTETTTSPTDRPQRRRSGGSIGGGGNTRIKQQRLQQQIDEDPPLNEDEIQLDYNNADLQLKPMHDNVFQVDPENKDGFALMWAGIKASYGVQSGSFDGRIAYQVKIIELLSLVHLPFDEIEPHDIRIGWSEQHAPYQLGEAPHSYAYCATGRKALNSVFTDYGETFAIGDTITCCMDLTTGDISYYKNTMPMGIAFNVHGSGITVSPSINANRSPTPPLIPPPTTNNLIFFPHIATKNCRFEVNFGQKNDWVPLPDDCKFMHEIDRKYWIRGPIPPANKSECTVLMMVGLPGAGKTTWVRQYLRDHPDEHWTVLNTDSIMSAMKVNGIARNRIHQARWDMIMGLTAKALTRSLHLACRRRKNYIIDQTNCARDTRRKKLVQFREFQRKCVVIVPDEDELINRQFRQERTEGMGPMPAEAMLELKAVFSLPNKQNEPIEDVHYIEPPLERIHEAFELVHKYNEQAKPWFHQKQHHRGGGGHHQRK